LNAKKMSRQWLAGLTLALCGLSAMADDASIRKNLAERLPNLPMYFYDADSVRREFEPYGLVECSELEEPSHGVALPFINVICRKESSVAVGAMMP